ncbi:GNAT family N-acetyltransferase [Lacimicrobium alkaliphilum]|uniref:Acetyltransferase n=1 Tax=Lacimicrobium alkaliphilum TaxID=1526571 RepID=A0ABQ1R7T8_9ALTE|nr:GNAT family N-acetyltransferase [Lacimicrobium alkaliphilum]GGD61458.1 acetyltransferase [Lacimicrobium alkaliphilum]
MSIKLIAPDMRYQQSYHQYIQELGDEERYPFPLDFDYQDFPAYLARLTEFEQGVNLPPGYVPSSTYWLVENDELIGVSSLRHSLNDIIRHAGGHIGMSIRPSHRGKGLSKTLLQLTIGKAKAMGIETVHIHCYRHNTASARMILAFGGVLESEVILDQKPQSDIIQRYLCAV